MAGLLGPGGVEWRAGHYIDPFGLYERSAHPLIHQASHSTLAHNQARLGQPPHPPPGPTRPGGPATHPYPVIERYSGDSEQLKPLKPMGQAAKFKIESSSSRCRSLN